MSPCRPHTTPVPLKQFHYGVCYYPEHWDEATRAGDPELFREAGWNVVRMAEFAWNVMEPEPEQWDFTLFEETINRLGEEGINTILCTPTATPPHWLTLQHPEMLRVNATGVPLTHGSRQHASHFSPVLRESGCRIVAKMAGHFAANPYVIGWQTDNEFHCHFSEDHSPDSQRCFAEFLREKFHGDIDALNHAWGTGFWAQTYRTFEEIPTPRPALPTHLNPAHVLDYYRHLAHGVATFQREQIEILRAANPDWWVTHNGCFSFIDYAGDFGADLDFMGYDSYPGFDRDPQTRPSSQAFNVDMVRAFSGNFMILEQQSGPGGQGDYFLDNPAPGEMRRLAYTNIARGTDGLLFFRERTCPFGAEEYWCGVLDHDNVPRRRYQEARQMGEELKRLGPLVMGTSVQVSVGIAGGDFTSQYGHLPLSLGLPAPRQAAEGIHEYFFQEGHAVGCVHPGDRLDGLAHYIVPHLSLFDPAWLEHWEEWVRAGGILIIGARTGSKDRNNNVITETLPGALRPLAGLTVEEYGRQNRPDRQPKECVFPGGARVATELWYELLKPDGDTQVLAHWDGGHLSGGPAITRRKVGNGEVIYVGTYFTPPVLKALCECLISEDLLKIPEKRVAGVSHVVRTSPDYDLHFYVNHNEQAVSITLDQPGRELLKDEAVDQTITLDSGEVAVVHVR